METVYRPRGIPSAMVSVAVTPEASLADEPVKIQVTGLLPHQLVTLQASAKDEKGFVFQSRAFYRGDSSGEVDLEQAEASGGHYQGVLPMGLFWTLTSVKPFHRLMKRNVMDSPLQVTLDVYDSVQMSPAPGVEPLASRTVERWFVTPGIQRTQIREGRVRGALFIPAGEGPFPGVIDMFGGVGGLWEFRASLLACHGFASLSLAYFAYDDLPQNPSEVDLDYFEEAADLLLRHPKVLGPGIGVVGVSKGAEIALLMATFLKQVKATVCINGPTSINGYPVHYRDRRMPCLPYYMEGIILTDSGAVDIHRILRDPRAPVYQDFMIPVEKASGHILFVVGGKDRNCNSKMYAEEAIERLKRHDKRNARLLIYEGAGHLIEPPSSPFCSRSHFPNYSQPMLWGGELVAHAKAQEHSWVAIQKFFQQYLGEGFPDLQK